MNRLEKLKELDAQKPEDEFLKFAIGLEYVSQNNDVEAAKYFEFLYDNFPHYIATYYQLGKLYERLNETAKAVVIYRKGMEECKAVQEFKTLGELNEALMTLEDE